MIFSVLKETDVRGGGKVQTELAVELCERLGDYNEEGFTLEDIKNAEELLNIQVKVVCIESFNSIIYSGKEKETKIFLILSFRRVLYIVCFLLGNSLASDF